MSEEMRHPQREAPKAMINTIIMAGISGLVFLVAVLFSIQDLDAVISTPTGIPIAEIYLEATNSVAGSTVLIFIPFLAFVSRKISCGGS